MPPPPSESALGVLRRKLEHLLVEQAKNADPVRGFQLKEEIREVRSQIAELEAEQRHVPADVANRIASDLSLAMASGELTGYEDIGTLIHRCLLSFPNLRPDSDYDFAKLTKAIHLASEALGEAVELFNLGKDLPAKEELVEGLGYLVVALAHCCHRSSVLSKALVSVVGSVLTIDDIPCELDSGCERELYRLAIYSKSPRDEQIEELLSEWIKP